MPTPAAGWEHKGRFRETAGIDGFLWQRCTPVCCGWEPSGGISFPTAPEGGGRRKRMS